MQSTEHNLTLIPCTPYNARLSVNSCILNLTLADAAYNMLTNGHSVFQIDDIHLDRLMNCSKCEQFPKDRANLVEDLMMEIIRDLIDQVENWDLHHGDAEVMEVRRKARGKRYREKNEEKLKLDKQIAYLEKQMEEIWNEGTTKGKEAF